MCDHKHHFISIIFASALSAMGAASASADTFYFYTGNLYTDVTGSYTTSMKVTGFIDLVTPLGDNFGPATIVPLHFSFSDGLQTFTDTTAGLTSNFDVFGTDPTGKINNWDASFSILAGLGWDEMTVTSSGDNPQDFWSCSTSTAACLSTAFVNTAGNWAECEVGALEPKDGGFTPSTLLAALRSIIVSPAYATVGCLPTSTPIPDTLPLFATGLGILGLFLLGGSRVIKRVTATRAA